MVLSGTLYLGHDEEMDKEAIRELMHKWFYLVDEGKAVEALDRFTTEDVTFIDHYGPEAYFS